MLLDLCKKVIGLLVSSEEFRSDFLSLLDKHGGITDENREKIQSLNEENAEEIISELDKRLSKGHMGQF